MNNYEATEIAYKNGYEAGKKDAEDEIRILKQKRANIFEIMDAYERGRAKALKWIPVTERLPEPWKWILCYCEVGNIEMLRYDDFMDEWGSINLNRAYKKDYVTHWMPLPEPPKGE